jgi:serine/threonine protein kinase
MIKKVIVKDKLLNPDTLKYAQQESDLHAMVSNHTNVVKLYDQNENEKQFEMYMEYCDKGDYFAEKVQEVSLKTKFYFSDRLLGSKKGPS